MSASVGRFTGVPAVNWHALLSPAMCRPGQPCGVPISARVMNELAPNQNIICRDDPVPIVGYCDKQLRLRKGVV